MHSESTRGRVVSAQSRMQVAVRIRPPPEGCHEQTLVVEEDVIRQGGREFAFDSVILGQQEEVYERCAKPMVQDAMEGYNTCLFAYGQTGAGKTYTLLGLPGAGLPLDAEHTPHTTGLLPRFLRDLSECKQQKLHHNPQLKITMTISVLEIYNEEVRDLLSWKSGSEKAPTLMEDSETRQVVVVGAVEAQVDCSDQAMQLLQRGVHARETAATGMNDQSSRSHMVVILAYKQRDESNQTSLVSNIKFVDLAGSECLSRTGTEGLRRREGSHINKSLLVLGKALNSFSNGTPMQEMRGMLRESKLTRLLSENFGGNSKTRMLAMVSPLLSNESQSLSTLSYATRAKNIALHATQNKLREAEASKVKQLQHLLDCANAELEAQRASREVTHHNLDAALLDVSTMRDERDAAASAQREAETALAAQHDTLSQTTNTIQLLRDKATAATSGQDEALKQLEEVCTQLDSAQSALSTERDTAHSLKKELSDLQEAYNTLETRANEGVFNDISTPASPAPSSRLSRTLSVGTRPRKTRRRSSADTSIESDRKRVCTEQKVMQSQLQRAALQNDFMRENLQQHVEQRECTEEQRRTAVATNHSLQAKIAGLLRELRESQERNDTYARMMEKGRCIQCKKSKTSEGGQRMDRMRQTKIARLLEVTQSR